MADNPQLELARQQIEFARGYTLALLEGLEPEQWYLQPAGSPTHIAWQVGHLAMAQYGLGLFRQRGRQPIDAELMSSAFRKQFSRGSVPRGDGPDPEEIRQTLDRVHAQLLAESARWTDADLVEPVDEPYAVYANRLGALLFCAHHEMLHAGQIGLLRRLLGLPPVR